MKLSCRTAILAGTAVLLAGVTVAQNFGGFGGGGGGFGGFGGGRRGGGRWNYDTPPIIHTEGGDELNEDTVRTARETVTHSTGTPNWTNAPGFERDVFTFCRIIYKFEQSPGPAWLAWVNDYPDSDLNLSWRIQMMTSLKTDPDGRVLKLTNADLVNYPFIYAVKPGRMELRDEEVPILRRYLLNGGALMVDDFWGDREWENFDDQMKRVFPDRHWVDLPISHPLFHCVFNIKVTDMNKLQVPNIHMFERTGSSSSRRNFDAQEMHVRVWFDDKNRIMVIALHNTDNGDGWEREGEEHEYFQIFSEQRAYPIAINTVFYLMTH